MKTDYKKIEKVDDKIALKEMIDKHIQDECLKNSKLKGGKDEK